MLIALGILEPVGTTLFYCLRYRRPPFKEICLKDEWNVELMWCKKNPYSHSDQDYIDRRCNCLSYSTEHRHQELREMFASCAKRCKEKQRMPA